jgi:hypothetical protein
MLVQAIGAPAFLAACAGGSAGRFGNPPDQRRRNHLGLA